MFQIDRMTRQYLSFVRGIARRCREANVAEPNRRLLHSFWLTGYTAHEAFVAYMNDRTLSYGGGR